MLAMADAATKTITIAASPAHCYDVVTEFERYPEWVNDIVAAEVVDRDASGRPRDVKYTVSALGRNTRYTLRYDYAEAPDCLRWELVEGDIMRAIDGSYRFVASTLVPGSTDVTYDLSIELVVPMPGFLKRRAEARILNTVHHLKSRAEG
jgi:ribosome-associated toxin RatA of RatAB toxin-antitoxin module